MAFILINLTNNMYTSKVLIKKKATEINILAQKGPCIRPARDQYDTISSIRRVET